MIQLVYYSILVTVSTYEHTVFMIAEVKINMFQCKSFMRSEAVRSGQDYKILILHKKILLKTDRLFRRSKFRHIFHFCR